ncbi:MAG TPA: DUF1648 domain-containing protein [Candidatus Merdisoma merdipullorum]|nr:DUF1648 domain-containing protein [Candidatus Merdisoma merdipullorum]
MKTKKTVYLILMLLPLAFTLIALPFLPAQIPAHYGADNQVTRWGSKYEVLIFPAISLLFGLFMLAMGKYAAKQEGSGNNNEKVIIISGSLFLLLFNLLTLYFLYADFHQVADLSEIPVDVTSLVFFCLGILLIICGNIMPKLKNNSIVGLRTKWSRTNEVTWKKSQKFGGITFMISGLLIIVISLLTKAETCFLWSMLILAADLAVSVWYSWRAAKKYG